MGIAVARAVAQPPSIQCRICGRPTAGGAKLCGQCVAAVKRARQVRTITSQFLPPTGQGVIAPPQPSRSRSAARRRSAYWSWLPTKPGGWGVVAAFTLFGAAVGVTAYFAVQEIAESTVVVTMPSGVPDLGIRASVAPAVDSAVTAGSSSISEGNDVPPAASAAVIIDAPPPALPPQKSTFRRPSTENRIGKGGPAPAGARAAGETEATGAQGVAANTGPPVPTVARAPIAQAPPMSDRWDTMNAALASCSGDNLLAGVVCTERVRLQYCEGFWGQVPQCRGATRPGNSR
jgi:hypothetical protein